MNTNNPFQSHLFISTTAWVFIILASVALYLSVFNIAIYKISIEAQKELFQSVGDGSNDDFLLKMQETFQMVWLFLLVGMLSSFVLLIAAINLLKHKNWARILFTVICLLIAGMFIAFGFYLKYQVGEMRNLFNLSLSGDGGFFQLKLANQIQLISYLIFFVVVAWGLVRVLIKLNSKTIRTCFD